MIIENFSYIYSTDESYDRLENPDRLNIFELSPLGISWYYEEQYYEITNARRLYALLLQEKVEIAIVEAPFDNSNNDAYIVDAKGKKIWDVRYLFHIRYKTIIKNYYASFDYPIYESSDLYFHVTINNLEYRFAFDILTGNMGELIESR
jgi:hypothetical protein